MKMSQATGTRPLASLRRRGISAAVLLALAVSVLGGVPAHADGLDDKAAALKQQAEDVEASLEFVDASIAKSASDLVLYQGRMPAAQQALSDAETRVSDATAAVNSLAARVELAQQSKDQITTQLATDQKKQTEVKKVIGQIAAQSYKSGGVPTSLGLLLGLGSATDLANSMDLADQAMRSQNDVLAKVNAQAATNKNSQARLDAVETEIKDLKAQADTALDKETAARNDAAAKKASVDKLVSDTAALNKKLEAQKPAIKAKMAQVKVQQDAVAADIAERQRKAREAAEAAARAAAAAAGNNNYVAPAPGPVSAFGLRHPFAADIPITSGYGWRQTPAGTIDFNGTGSYLHTGIDFGATCGTPVYAPAPGTVEIAGWTNYGGGNTVRISHGVVQGNALTTVYYHNTSVQVSAGQHVNTGDLIAYTGSTGNSTGCHAHFETWLNGTPVDPMTVLGS